MPRPPIITRDRRTGAYYGRFFEDIRIYEIVDDAERTKISKTFAKEILERYRDA